jgi:hypothetical protein
MNKREFLRNKGFKVGERGRFNDAMKSAISAAEESGTEFDTPIPPQKRPIIEIKLEKIRASIPEQKIMREARELYGYTKEGAKVGFITCTSCHQHMIYCNCSGIFAPSVVAYTSDPLVKIRS